MNIHADVKGNGMRLDIWLPALIGIFGLGMILFLVEHNPNPTRPELLIWWIIIALSGAAFGALIPGIFNINLSASGVGIRAGGAIAVFAAILFFPPAQNILSKAFGIPGGGVKTLVDESFSGLSEIKKGFGISSAPRNIEISIPATSDVRIETEISSSGLGIEHGRVAKKSLGISLKIDGKYSGCAYRHDETNGFEPTPIGVSNDCSVKLKTGKHILEISCAIEAWWDKDQTSNFRDLNGRVRIVTLPSDSSEEPATQL